MGRVPKTRILDIFQVEEIRCYCMYVGTRIFGFPKKTRISGSNILRHISIHKYHTVKSSFKQPHTHTIHWLYYIQQLKKVRCENRPLWLFKFLFLGRIYLPLLLTLNIIYHSVLNHFPKCGCRTFNIKVCFEDKINSNFYKKKVSRMKCTFIGQGDNLFFGCTTNSVHKSEIIFNLPRYVWKENCRLKGKKLRREKRTG